MTKKLKQLLMLSRKKERNQTPLDLLMVTAMKIFIIRLFHFCCVGHVKDEYSSLIQRFKLAWNSCRSFLGDQGKEAISLSLDVVEEIRLPHSQISTTGSPYFGKMYIY